ncbi:MAG TPA: Ig-like domain-containing protein, partial [Methylomirabilota bacterium]|nr:Ig-like domain-containing protein [Methylomirabilota bacterium]
MQNAFVCEVRAKRRWEMRALAFVAALISGGPVLLAQTSVTLAWDPNPETNLVGYIVRYGTSSGNYSTTVPVGLATSRQITGLTPGTTYYFAVYARNVFDLESVPSDEVSYTLPPTSTPPPTNNTAPVISTIANQTVNRNTSTGPIPFTIGDAQTSAANLTLSASSSATGLLPPANVVFGGSGSNRTVSVTPGVDRVGTATITITVSDGYLTATRAFNVTVLAGSSSNTPPTITALANQTVNEDTATPTQSFTIGDGETAASSLTLTAASSNPTLVPTNRIMLGGSGANRTVSVLPATNQSGTATITLTVGDGTTTAARSFVVTVNAVNDSPTLSAIANQTINEDSATAALPVTVGDVETAAASLTLSASSSNPTLVPANRIVLGGSGANRTVTVYPATNQSGTATITLTVSDGAATSSRSFGLTVSAVNDAPIITAIPNQTVTAGSTTPAIPMTIGDVETAATSLTLSGASSNPILVPNNQITFGGSGSNRTVTVRPAAGQTGTATITVTVSDGSLTASRAFAVSVTAASNTAPVISSLADQSVAENQALAALGFTVSDAETAASSLVVSAASSNPALVPTNRITLGGSGSSRTVTVQPASNQVGQATITLTVSDGSLTASRSFVLTVVAASNTAPAMTAIADVTIDEDGVASAVGFSISDRETAADALIVSASSSNVELLPLDRIALGGSGHVRHVTLRPVPERSGTSTISLTVSDGSLTATRTFVVTVDAVNDAPTISAIGNQVVLRDGLSAPIPFTVGDIDTPLDDLIVSVSAGAPGLLPVSGILLTGSGANRTLQLRPATNQVGTTTVTVTVSDGVLNAREQFNLTVVVTNSPPVITLPPGFATTADRAAWLRGLNVEDRDSGESNVTVRLSVDYGTLTLNAGVAGGLSASQISGNGSSVVTASASLTALRVTLEATNGLVFQPPAGFVGEALLTVMANDNGHTGAGGDMRDSRTAGIAVTGSSLAGWRTRAFGEGVVNDPDAEATIWGDAADPDEDGRQNLLEFA